ncbi:bifunctional 3-deoxy-7-phosphoheptulonate synthase/chorismate mutase [Brochothrix thermosphacta]|uniref:bifunctional 3-deoxy-7-phosphoheptulonate synthase/chorismate mutase n=1 Tax=Brochothrix thermosphacta TaxID=2756 RepID=UPI000D7B4A60|nr:bifunctional 3-deoxy-7-phosphoheptulonate synthase/chorismate mutase [Brochothrix thermosphacta]SPN75603.1 3-deoxy-D-arabino-heptulosonate 7-phosphate synthase; chorismate mutase-isozyme 3 [Brochothrix thermosphacta]
MNNQPLDELRAKIDLVNKEILDAVNKRQSYIAEIGDVKSKQGFHRYDPVRERDMLNKLIAVNEGPLTDQELEYTFKEIFKVGLEKQEQSKKKELLVSRKRQPENTVVTINGVEVGNGKPAFVFGPCAVESFEQTSSVADKIKSKGLNLMRGGAFKPRTSPYDFQGLGVEGLEILDKVRKGSGLGVISEIVSPLDVEVACEHIDVIQIGARNMQNFELLKAVGKTNKPVLLKRGLAATIDEFIHAAEYILAQGNPNVILCERGIRTYEKATRNTLDLSAVPILKQETHLPVMVDVTHSTGRKDIMLPCAKAALAVGADGVMAEVHPDPAVALSDSAQQMDFEEFDAFWDELKAFAAK